MPWERGRPARILFLWPPLSFSAMLQAATLSAGTAAASPHFSPGGAIMAQEFFPQRVLASEGRSGDTIRASMCALRGKGQARARPAQSVPRRLQSKNRKMLKTSTFRHCAQRPGEKCGPGRRRAMAPFPVDPSGGDGRGCARLGAGGTPALPGSHHCAGGTPALPGSCHPMTSSHQGHKLQKYFGAACR